MELPEKVLFMAFRYALGRMTYVSLEMSEILIEKWDKISPSMRLRIQSEIRDAIDYDMAGMDMDIQQWQRVLGLKP